MTDDTKPRCVLEVVNPDDILVVGINNSWFRSFTSSSDRYPLKLEIPAEFVEVGVNLITGEYTNVAVTGKNDAEVEYKLYLEDDPVVHVVYRTEVHPQTFSLTFRDSFHSDTRAIDRGEIVGRSSSRYDELMNFGD